MKKIGNKVLLMIAVFVVIFGINTAVSVRTQKSVKLAGARITEQYIPIQTEIFNIQKSMERGQKYLNIISLYDDDDLRQQLETSLADEITTIAESEKSISAYLEKMDQTDLADKIKNYELQLLFLVIYPAYGLVLGSCFKRFRDYISPRSAYYAINPL